MITVPNRPDARIKIPRVVLPQGDVMLSREQLNKMTPKEVLDLLVGDAFNQQRRK